MAINTGAIQQLLRPGLAEVFGDYPMYPSQWTEIFEKATSDKQTEVEVEMKFLGLAAIKAEGAATEYDNMGQAFIFTYVHRYVSIGFIITRQAIKDNLYKDRFPQQAKSLKNSMLQTKEVLGASVLNNGFSSIFPGGDAVALFSTAHPLVGGATYSNTFTTQADLNETSLQDAIVAVQRFKDQAGLRVMVQPQKLIVPPPLQWTANRLLNSQFRTGSANNDISAVYNVDAVPQGYRVNQFLTDDTAWFLKTNGENGLKYYEREALETDTYSDFDTSSVKALALERYSFGWSNPRGMFGSSGTL